MDWVLGALACVAPVQVQGVFHAFQSTRLRCSCRRLHRGRSRRRVSRISTECGAGSGRRERVRSADVAGSALIRAAHARAGRAGNRSDSQRARREVRAGDIGEERTGAEASESTSRSSRESRSASVSARQEPAQTPPLTSSWPSSTASQPPAAPVDTSGQTARPAETPAEPVRAPEPPQKTFEELVVSSDSVIGLQTETRITSETAHVEDRLEARVTRDVKVGDRVAIPSGARVLGTVTQVDRGGKFKERARLGVRFHTLVLADGTRIPISTETIYRDGESPANSSAAKVGGGAAVGAILGAIIGGGKGRGDWRGGRRRRRYRGRDGRRSQETRSSRPGHQ